MRPARTAAMKKFQRLAQKVIKESGVAEGVSRRDLIRNSLAVAGVGAMSAGFGECHDPDLPFEGRVIVVGAGAAGLTAAMDLVQAGHTDVELFEAGDHVGGRTDSYTLTDSQGRSTVYDKGGMFLDVGHLEAIELCQELGLGADLIDRNDAAEQLGAVDTWVWVNPDTGLREEISEDLLAEQFQSIVQRLQDDYLASLDPANDFQAYYDLSYYPGGLGGYLDDIIPADHRELRSVIDAIMVTEFGLPVRDAGDGVVQDALNYVYYAYAFPEEYEDPEAFNVSGFADVRWQLRGGMVTMANALRDAFLTGGGSITYNYKLVEVSTALVGGYKLRFEPTDGSGFPIIKWCDYVMMAIPFPQ